MTLRLPDEFEFDDPSTWYPIGECTTLDSDEKELFTDSSRESARKAVEYCGHCAIKEICLEYAIEREVIYGVWGGTDEKERREIIKNMRNEFEEKAS